jgi:aminomethyltransferase
MTDTGGTSDGAVKRLPLHEEHERLGARMTTFGGWIMPLAYSSIIEEHLQVRTRAGLFDISHMGKFVLSGSGALEAVDKLVAGNVAALEPGKARYTVLLTPWGGVQDDLIVYRRDDDMLLIVNAARTASDREWIEEHLPDDVELDDLTELTCLFALQGPKALGVLAPLSSDHTESLPPFSFAVDRVAGIEATVMRTGYTGEDGVELLVSADDGLRLWQTLLAADDVEPCGLGARDTLRLEAALLLNGQDMTKSTTPYEARLGRLVDLDRPDFEGRADLLVAKAAGPERLLVGLSTQSHLIPRTGADLRSGATSVGRVTSGSVSPVLGHPIALGYVRPAYAEIGTELTALVRGREVPMAVVPRPFYRKGETPVPGLHAALPPTDEPI